MRRKVLFQLIILLFLVNFSFAETLKYVPDPTCADQNSKACTRSIINLLTAIGTTNKAIIELENKNPAGTTYTYASNADHSAYTNVVFRIAPGAVISHGAFTLNIPNRQLEGVYQWLAGTGTVTLSGSVNKVSPGEFTENSTPGTTDMTTAINYAIATGKNIEIDGIHATTGLHRLSTDQQVMYGVSGGTLKKLSGTNYILDTTHGVKAFLKNMIFDGNNLGGSAVIWRGHYSGLSDVTFKNQGGTSYALWFSGMNLSVIEKLNFLDSGTGVYGGILFDNDNDTYVPKPTYAALYSSFNDINIAATVGGANIEFKAASSSTGLEWNNLYIEDTGGGLASLKMNGQLQKDIIFNGIKSEYVLLAAPLVSIEGDESTNIQFNGGSLTSNAAQTQTVFNFDTLCRNVGIKNIHFGENSATPSLAGRILISLSGTRNAVIENNDIQLINNYTFISSLTAGANSYIVDRNNINAATATWTGIGTNTIQATGVVSENSNLLQNISASTNVSIQNGTEVRAEQPAGTITVADDAYYEIHGSGGVSAAGDFVGIITIGTWASAVADQNNAAIFYAQVSSGSGTQLHTNISVGSNVEIDDVADNTAAALATTTDGKLGVQIGWAGGGANRFVRVYNRTGSEISLKVHILRF